MFSSYCTQKTANRDISKKQKIIKQRNALHSNKKKIDINNKDEMEWAVGGTKIIKLKKISRR